MEKLELSMLCANDAGITCTRFDNTDVTRRQEVLDRCRQGRQAFFDSMAENRTLEGAEQYRRLAMGFCGLQIDVSVSVGVQHA